MDRLGNTAVLSSIAMALASSLYLGLASCGAYLWHQQALYGINVAMYLAALASPGTLLPSRKHKFVFAISLPVVAVVLSAAAAPFYPSHPQSMTEYLATFLSALQFGACS